MKNEKITELLLTMKEYAQMGINNLSREDILKHSLKMMKNIIKELEEENYDK